MPVRGSSRLCFSFPPGNPPNPGGADPLGYLTRTPMKSL
jgi:hypothetical protein